jgi:hypothetical protein
MSDHKVITISSVIFKLVILVVTTNLTPGSRDEGYLYIFVHKKAVWRNVG